MYQKFHTLRSACCRCKQCDLWQSRTQVVFGDGSERAAVLFIGEAPGAKEDAQGLPFIGRGGQLMNQMLEQAGIRREEIFITNLVKCRPPANRDPAPAEQQACYGWLTEQIRLLNPDVIVCIGRISAMQLIDKAFKVTKQHGRIYEKDGRAWVGMYHPAAVLRNPRLKDDAQNDFLQLKAYLDQTKKGG